MLQLFRDNAGSWIIKIMLLLIALAFVISFGFSSYNTGGVNKVAVVNEQIISVNEYNIAYSELRERYRQRLGGQLPDVISGMLKNQVMNQLINKTLLLQKAEKLQLKVSYKEIDDYIRNINAFHTDGSYDPKKYQMFLTQRRKNHEYFSEIIREDLMLNKIQSIIMGSVKVTEDEVKEWFLWNNTSIDIDYVVFEPENNKNIKPTNENIEKFYKENGNKYKTVPMIKVKYITFNPDEYKDKVNINKKDIEEYYQANIKKFLKEKTIEVRHIIIKVDNNATKEIAEQKRKKALKIYKLAKQGKDFASLAKKYSEGPTKKSGGFLGKIKKGQMVTNFEEKVFSMKNGEICEPLKTIYGWHVIKVEKIKDAITEPLDKVTPEIKNILIKDIVANFAYDEAEEVFKATLDGYDLKQASEGKNLKIVDTDFFSNEGPKSIKERNRSKFASETLKLFENDISDIIELNGIYYLIQLIEKKPSVIPELKTVRNRVVADLIEKMQNEIARNDANEFIKSMKDEKSFEILSKKYKVKIINTGLFKRNKPIPDIGSNSDITEAVFNLTINNYYTKNILKNNQNYYIFKLKKRIEPEINSFEFEKEKIQNDLNGRKLKQVFNEWLNHIKTESEIYIENQFQS